MDKKPTLRSIKDLIVIFECKACGLYGELDRKEVLRRFKATAPLSRVRLGIVGHCDRMYADDIDRCEAHLSSAAASRGDR